MPGIRPAVLLHSLPFSFRNNSLSPRTLPLIVMKSKIGSECLLWSSSKKLPDNCNHGWWWGFSVSLATDILFTKCPPGSEAAGLSAGANGPIPQAKCYSRRWWKNCVGLLLLSAACRTIMRWWDLSIQTKKLLMKNTHMWMQYKHFSQKMQFRMHGGKDTQEKLLCNIQT